MKEIVTYKHGEFVDFKGEKRNVTVCAISDTAYDSKGDLPVLCYPTKGDDASVDIHTGLVKRLRIGYSVCTPPDVYNEKLGETKAYGCAKSVRGKELYSTHSGIINSKSVDAILDQELDFICNHPEAVVYCYAKAKKEFDEGNALIEKYSSLSDDQKEIVSAGLNGVDLLELADLVDALKENKTVELEK